MDKHLEVIASFANLNVGDKFKFGGQDIEVTEIISNNPHRDAVICKEINYYIERNPKANIICCFRVRIFQSDVYTNPFTDTIVFIEKLPRTISLSFRTDDGSSLVYQGMNPNNFSFRPLQNS